MRRPSSRYFVFLALLFVEIASTTTHVHALPNQTRSVTFDAGRKEYSAVLKEDPEVKDLMRWEKAASTLLLFATVNPKSPDTPKALYLLGRLYEQTYQRRSFRTGLSRAVYFYEQLSSDYRGHQLADDALLSLGDLRRQALKDEAGAKAAYEEILARYPKGDMVGKARERLAPRESSAEAKADEPTETISKVEIGKSTDKLGKQEAVEKLKRRERNLFDGLPKKGEGKVVFKSKQPKDTFLVVIDAGHGGEELGAIGIDGDYEKDVVLNISMYLDEYLRERLRAKTVLTRARDVTLSLPERTKIANDQKADLFISLHANASELRNIRGIETYYLDNTNDQSSIKLAERENQSMSLPKGDLGFMLSDLIQTGKQEDSIRLAHYIQDNLVKTISRYYRDVKDLGVKKAPFYVLVGAHMPCVLVEVSFIDHPVEGRRLAQRQYQKLLADALYRGIRSYFERELSKV